MMMMGMGSAWMMVMQMLLGLFIVLGFGYIVWILAVKESGNTKLTGQVIAIVIIVLAVVLCLYGAVKGPSMRNQMMGQEMMMKQMGEMGKMPPSMDRTRMMKGGWKK